VKEKDDDDNESGSQTPRFDTKNKSCLGQGGIMDYAKTDENTLCILMVITNSLSTF